MGSAMLREGGRGDVRVYRQIRGADGKWKTAPKGARRVDRWRVSQMVWPMGDRKPREVSRFGTVREHAERDLRNAVEAVMGDRSRDGITGDSSLAEAVEAYRETVLVTLKSSTRDEYARDLDRELLGSAILNRKLSVLDKAVLTRELQRIGREHGHCARHVKAILSGAFDLSSIANPVRSISARALQLPDPKDVTPLTVEQRDHVILTARSRAKFPGKGSKEVTRVKLQAVYELVVVGFSVGLRIGEVLALLWEDVDLEAGVLDVHDGGSDGSTKTRAGTRQVPMTPDLRKVLLARRERMGGTGYVFGSPADQLKPWDASNVQDDMADLREASKIAGFHYHVCRHTFAVMCLRNGVDVYSLAQTLGHADPSVTLRTYSRFVPKRDLSHVVAGIPGMAL